MNREQKQFVDSVNVNISLMTNEQQDNVLACIIREYNNSDRSAELIEFVAESMSNTVQNIQKQASIDSNLFFESEFNRVYNNGGIPKEVKDWTKNIALLFFVVGQSYEIGRMLSQEDTS